MWIATRFGFFSVVCARKSRTSHEINPDIFMVRVRRRQHLEALLAAVPKLALPGEIMATVGTDYPFRLFVSKKKWIETMVELSEDIDYGNFKNEAHKFADHKYDAFLGSTWSLGLRLEDGRRNYLDQTIVGTEPEEEPVEEDLTETFDALSAALESYDAKKKTNGRHRRKAAGAKGRGR